MTPTLRRLFLVVTLSSIGLPGTNGFIGEFLILAGTYRLRLRAMGTAAGASRPPSGVILGAVYMLTLYQKVYLGPIRTRRSR